MYAAIFFVFGVTDKLLANEKAWKFPCEKILFTLDVKKLLSSGLSIGKDDQKNLQLRLNEFLLLPNNEKSKVSITIYGHVALQQNRMNYYFIASCSIIT